MQRDAISDDAEGCSAGGLCGNGQGAMGFDPKLDDAKLHYVVTSRGVAPWHDAGRRSGTCADRVFAATLDRLIALDARTGAQLWKWEPVRWVKVNIRTRAVRGTHEAVSRRFESSRLTLKFRITRRKKWRTQV